MQEYCASTSSNDKRRTLKQPSVFKYDKELFLVFQEQRRKGTPISGPILKEKALDMLKKHGGENFSASDGWLSMWRKKYGVRPLAICGERMSSDTVAAEEYKTTFRDLLRVILSKKTPFFPSLRLPTYLCCYDVTDLKEPHVEKDGVDGSNAYIVHIKVRRYTCFSVAAVSHAVIVLAMCTDLSMSRSTCHAKSPKERKLRNFLETYCPFYCISYHWQYAPGYGSSMTEPLRTSVLRQDNSRR
ncbi:hypothetical protein ANN_11395 [Periplaneta americana]|uniref:HTH CENPB-type domain-containing protein n=1 Tax=Periplaneta americana TaxID=6978 RepID=A0ABQ8T4W0_PERAM|nr:hypothetical protein ANN_11395 [Periplaneta americana]